MTPRQKLEIRASEIRTKLSELAGLDELSDEQRGEIGTLRTEYQDVETRIQAITVAEDEPTRTPVDTGDGEGRELRELRERVEFGAYVGAALETRGVNGAAAEYNEHLGLGADRVPMEFIAPPLEQRAAVDGDAARTQSSWIDRLFADTAAMALGITTMSVEPGISSVPVLGSNADPKQRARTQDADTATISATVTEIKPSRNAVHAEYSIEDDARLPGLAEAIRRDLSAAMVEKIDRTVFVGDDSATGTEADIVGLDTASIGEVTLTQAAKVKADEVLKLFAALIDGKFAASMADLNLVATVGSNTLWLGTIHNAAAENQTIAQFLRANGASWTTRGEIEAATTAGKFGGFIGLRRGIANAALACVWSSGRLTVDPYSKAKSGEVLLTLDYLWGFKIPRAENWRRWKYVA